jgi:signal transduction histidine kinase
MIDLKSSPDEPSRVTLPRTLMHDLRTPVNHILGYSEMLIERANEGETDGLIGDLQRVRTAGKDLLALIDESFLSSNEPAAPKQFTAPSPPATATCLTGIETTTKAPRSEESTKGLMLVVDDNEGNRDVLSRLLHRQGYGVQTAVNGRQALEMMHAGAFDLVLLDIMMPEIDGYEVLERVKADERLRQIPVIMISALSELESVARCIELGAEDYLPKPFNPTLLKARVGASLEKKKAHDREIQLFEQLEQNYKRLQELEKLRDDLTHMIIHDLRTPLTSIIAGVQTMDVLGDLNDDQREMMGIALVGGDTLLTLINDLLDVEKLESGAMVLYYGLLSVSELVSASVGQVASLAEEKGVRLVLDIDDELPRLLGDESKLRRTLVNLLGNAMKFTPSGGTVTAGARQSEDGQSVVFSVRDTGEGIPAEAFERIFEKFGQVESRQSGRTMSTGLGLTFCKLAVESHGGHIEVESTPGQGSTFSFTIPLPE